MMNHFKRTSYFLKRPSKTENVPKTLSIGFSNLATNSSKEI